MQGLDVYVVMEVSHVSSSLTASISASSFPLLQHITRLEQGSFSLHFAEDSSRGLASLCPFGTVLVGSSLLPL